jgi:tRNA U34 5-methylaminomethyl-2-thiouridine-forming methyltransferase MnmC
LKRAENPSNRIHEATQVPDGARLTNEAGPQLPLCYLRRVQSQVGYKLVRLVDGAYSVHSLAHRETFHPVIGPVAEADALYVRQLRLAERMRAAQDEWVIWDVGLGAAANVLTVLRKTRKIGARVHVISFDCTIEPLRFALEHSKQLGYFGGYETAAHQLISNHRVRFPNGEQTVAWELVLADFPSFLGLAEANALPKPHAILFDAFSPAKNPAMWTLPVFTDMYRLLDPQRPCALATYSRSTMLRVSLLLAGFVVGTGQATGEKEETTIAANGSELIEVPLNGRWLQRARKSNSAEPLREARYRQAPLSAESWERLATHPQFASRGGLGVPSDLAANGENVR